jgi:hypothetical protein
MNDIQPAFNPASLASSVEHRHEVFAACWPAEAGYGSTSPLRWIIKEEFVLGHTLPSRPVNLALP